MGWWGLDGGHYDDIFERDAADTRYRQNERQNSLLKEQNELQRELLNQQKQQQIENKYQREQEQINNQIRQMELEQERQSHEELMRYYRLCDEMDFDYNDIKKLEYWLKNPTAEQWIRYYNVDNKYKSLVVTPKLSKLYIDKSNKLNEYLLVNEKVEKLFQEDNEKDVMLRVANEKAIEEFEKGNVENVTTIMDYVKERNSDDFISITGISNYRGGTVEEISELLPKMEGKIKQSIRTALLLISIGILGLCAKDARIVYVSIFIFIIGLYNLLRSITLKTNKQIIQKAFDKHQEDVTTKKKERDTLITTSKRLYSEFIEISEQISNMEKQQEGKLLETNQDFAQLKDEREYLSKHIIDAEETLNQIEFNNFRKQHYCDEVERLFRKVGFNSLPKLSSNEIKANGTAEDYIKFIEDNVLIVDDLYFEDYDAYYEKTFPEDD